MTTKHCPKCQVPLSKHMIKNLDILFCPTCEYRIEDPCNKVPELIGEVMLPEHMKLYVEGTKHDQGKLRMDLFPPEALEGITRILTFGAEKYNDRNWEKGIKYGRVFGALMRHMWAWWRGEDLDPESGCSHLWHAGCCICFLITYEARKMTDLDDRSKT